VLAQLDLTREDLPGDINAEGGCLVGHGLAGVEQNILRFFLRGLDDLVRLGFGVVNDALRALLGLLRACFEDQARLVLRALVFFKGQGVLGLGFFSVSSAFCKVWAMPSLRLSRNFLTGLYSKK